MMDGHFFDRAWFGTGRLDSGRKRNRPVDLLAHCLWKSQQLPAADLTACRYLSQLVKPENRETFLFFLLTHYTAFRRGSAFFPCSDAESLREAYLAYWTPALQWDQGQPGGQDNSASGLWEERESLSGNQAKLFLDELQGGAYRKVVGTDSSYPLVHEQQSGTPGIYFQKLYRVEREVSRMLLERLQPPPPEQSLTSPQAHPALQPHTSPQAPPAAEGDLPGKLTGDSPQEPLNTFWNEWSRTGTELNAEQKAAAALPLLRRVSLITGGPGTGKTTVMAAAVLLYCKTRGLSPRDVRITAPTGRAAAKLSESVTSRWIHTYGPLPDAAFRGETLHRLLGMSWTSQKPGFHPQNPLPARLVVVDEASMLDLPLFRQLLAALKPEAHLVLVGDKFQLPSVESGALLGDLSEYYTSLTDHAVHLEHTFRFPESISRIAGAVNHGDKEKLLQSLHESTEARIPEANGSGGTYWSCEAVPLRKLMESWVHHRFGTGYIELLTQVRQQEHHTGELDGTSQPKTHSLYTELWRQLSRGICLSPLRRGPMGSEGLNREFAGLYREQLYRHPLFRQPPDRNPELRDVRDGEWAAGMPLIITANDYSTGLFNGDPGLVVDTSQGLRALLLRRDNYTLYPLNQLRSFSPAFCLTVHKSQGSEFEEVLLLTPPDPHPLITRELLYTAVTRSKKWVGIYGQPEALARGMERRVERYSQLPQWLRSGRSP